MLVKHSFFMRFCLKLIVNHLFAGHPISDLMKISILYFPYREAKIIVILSQIFFDISFALRLTVYHFNSNYFC